MKALFSILLIILLAASIGGVYFLSDAMRKADSYHVAPSGTIVPKANVGAAQSMPVSTISVTAPGKGDTVTSPLAISGKAWGSWYFEGVFPVRLVDENRKEIARDQAHAQGEWTVMDFVPFRAELSFPPPATKTGILILERDNPSGLPQNAQSVEIPVTF